MNEFDEVSRRLPAILHAVMTLLSVPYVLLAYFFVFVGHVASQRGLWAILDTFLTTLSWSLTWGAVFFGLALITILTAGFFESLRWWATLSLAAMIATALGILLYYRGQVPDTNELIVLSPAFAILVTTCWTLIQRQ